MRGECVLRILSLREAADGKIGGYKEERLVSIMHPRGRINPRARASLVWEARGVSPREDAGLFRRPGYMVYGTGDGNEGGVGCKYGTVLRNRLEEFWVDLLLRLA